MNTTNGINTPGGSPVQLENPPSQEACSTDSGESYLLHQNLINPFRKSSRLQRSPPQKTSPKAQNKSLANPNVLIRETQALKQSTLEKENALLRKRLDEMELLCRELKSKVEKLESENKVSLPQNESSKMQTVIHSERSPGSHHYSTDEEELARETDWILKRRPSKKRKAGSSPEVAPQHEPNRKAQPKAEKQTISKRAPPPINITGVTDYNSLRRILKTTIATEFKVTSLRNDAWKIKINDAEGYRAVSQKLNNEKVQWHTYEDKSERPLRVVARGLHPSCAKEDVIGDLRDRGYNILDAVNLLKKERKRPDRGEEAIMKRKLPLFVLSFDKTESQEKIYNIRTIMSMVVKIEPLRVNTKTIPQCKRCQEFNHTQAYCRKEPRCVKCAGKHSSENCSLSKNEKATCVNCKGRHPANYRGCEVAKELQMRRRKSTTSTVRGTKSVDRAPKPVERVAKQTDRARKSVVQTPELTERTVESAVQTLEPVNQPPKPIKRTSKTSTKKTERKITPKKPTNPSSLTYSQAAVKATKQNDGPPSDPLKEILNCIYAKFEEQCEMNKRILERLSNVESFCMANLISKSK